jgi:hypothetical protein
MPAHHDYREKWVAAGYRSDMGSAIACLPKDAASIRVYHLTTADFAVSDIGLGRLKVARLSDLNDPFELIGLNFHERKTRKVIRDFKNAYDALTGLLSFSADWVESVMWSHYAMKHRGICLGFDVPRKLLQQVKYEDQRLRDELEKDPSLKAIPEKLQAQLLRTKFGGWKYENEYRRFVPLAEAIPEGRLHFMPFGLDLQLAEVILGPQCEYALETVRRLVDARYTTGVTTFVARLAFKWFKIVPNELTIP